MAKILILVAVVLAATCSVAVAKEQTTMQLMRAFVKLTDYLDEKLPTNEDPEANYEAVKKSNGALKMFKSDISPAVSLFKTIASAERCDSSLFEAISLVQASTQAQYPDTERRADKVLATFIDRALKKCDSYHEQALEEHLAGVPSDDKYNVESIISDEFIDSFKEYPDSRLLREKVNFVWHSATVGHRNYVLTKAVWTRAAHDPKNTIQLRDSPKPEDRRRVDEDTVEYVMKKYIINPCMKYMKAVDGVFAHGRSSSKFFAGGAEQFLKKRSVAYKNALVRRHICERVTNNIDTTVDDAETDLEVYL